VDATARSPRQAAREADTEGVVPRLESLGPISVPGRDAEIEVLAPVPETK